MTNDSQNGLMTWVKSCDHIVKILCLLSTSASQSMTNYKEKCNHKYKANKLDTVKH